MEFLTISTEKELSQRKAEVYRNYCKVLQWGRRNPLEFCAVFLGIELLDMQKYALYNAWTRDFILFLMSRNAGKTTLIAIYAMLRSMLLPYHSTYFLGNVGAQSREIFKKIEKIARREIDSFAGGTTIFLDELKRPGSKSEGFSHKDDGYETALFNGSTISTLNSDIINIKGRRAHLVCFDEAGWFSDELFVQAEQFANQDQDFKLGGGIDLMTEPKAFPRQLLYASSASDTTSGFYRKFRDFSKRMLMGDAHYFACNFNIEMVLEATYNGDPYPPLLSRTKVDEQLSTNHEKAMRELYNKFTSGVYEGQILTRREIMQHTVNRPPLLSNETGIRRFIGAWDSARINDNSVLIWAELILDKKLGWTMHVHNVESLVDVRNKRRSPMTFPEQIKRFHEMLLAYNANDAGKLDYENIEAIVCDAGPGGQMIGGVTDSLVMEWEDSNGEKHKGIIDTTHKAYETIYKRFPDALNIVRLVDPKGHRNDLFEALEIMVKRGVVTFPADWDGRDFLYILDNDGNENKYALSNQEQLSLAQIEMLKTEITTMCKYNNSGTIRYDYPADKRNSLHDDRIFAMSLLCWYLSQLRRGHAFERKVDNKDVSAYTSLARKPDVFAGSKTHKQNKRW